jgi:hypothetical protein
MAKTASSLFGSPVELTDNWINEHREHSLCWMNHTVFQKKKSAGQRFKECICYTCRKVARQLIGEVGEISAIGVDKPKRKKIVYKKQTKKTKETCELYF